MSQNYARWLKLINEYIIKTDKFEQYLNKLRVLSLADGKSKGEFVLDKDDLNSDGKFHIGLATALVDVTSAHALIAHGTGFTGVSTNIHVSHLQPGLRTFPGDVLSLDAKVCRVEGPLAFVEVDISKKNGGDLIVRGQHTLFIKRIPDDYKPPEYKNK